MQINTQRAGLTQQSWATRTKPGRPSVSADFELGGDNRRAQRRRHVGAVENRSGNALTTPTQIEWLSDKGSGYTADKTKAYRLEAAFQRLQPAEEIS